MNKTGKKVVLDLQRIESLALIGCTQDMIAADQNCSVDTLQRRCGKELKKGRVNLKIMLLTKQFEIAKGGNITMLIWLGKNYLHQTDFPETQNVNTLFEKLGLNDKKSSA